MEQARVYEIISEERTYQDEMAKIWNNNGKATVEAEILMMEKYLHDARVAWTTKVGDEPALDILRKIVAMGVRCFENHGVPSRITE